jgi:hypothetical protein
MDMKTEVTPYGVARWNESEPQASRSGTWGQTCCGFDQVDRILKMSSWGPPGRVSARGFNFGVDYGAQKRLQIGAVHAALRPPRSLPATLPRHPELGMGWPGTQNFGFCTSTGGLRWPTCFPLPHLTLPNCRLRGKFMTAIQAGTAKQSFGRGSGKISALAERGPGQSRFRTTSEAGS